jgi:hypothetical protein
MKLFFQTAIILSIIIMGFSNDIIDRLFLLFGAIFLCVFYVAFAGETK